MFTATCCLFRGAKKKPYLTVEQFTEFLNQHQRDPRLNEILYPFTTVKQAQEIINQHESKQGMAAKGEHTSDTLSADQFLFSPVHLLPVFYRLTVFKGV